MTAFTFAGRSNRYSGHFTLYGTLADLADAEQDHSGSLPTGFGDCLIHKVTLEIAGIVTMVTNPELQSVFMTLSPQVGGGYTEIIGNPRFRVYQLAAVTAHIEPYRPVTWYQNEDLRVLFGNIDTNVAASSDMYMYVDVFRLRSS